MAVKAPPRSRIDLGLHHWQSRIDHAAQLLAEARRRRGLKEFRCQNRECGRVMFEFLPPIGVVLQRCRRCGLYSELTTEPSG